MAIQGTGGGEGFVTINKCANEFDVCSVDITLTLLEGCYKEMRHNFTVAIERLILLKLLFKTTANSLGRSEFRIYNLHF